MLSLKSFDVSVKKQRQRKFCCKVDVLSLNYCFSQKSNIQGLCTSTRWSLFFYSTYINQNFRKPRIEKWMINFSLFKQINFKTQILYKGKVNILLNIKNFVHVSNKETTFSVYHEHIRTCTLSGGCCPASFIGCIFYHHWAWLIGFSYHAKNHYVLMDDRRKQQDILGSF